MLTAFAVSAFIYGWATSYIPAPRVVSAFWLGNLCAPWLVLAFFAGREVNSRWFAAALLAGVLYGALGHLWRRTRALPAGLAVAAGFLAEPVLWPLYNGFYKGPWFLWAAEVAVGVGVAYGFVVLSRARALPPGQDAG